MEQEKLLFDKVLVAFPLRLLCGHLGGFQAVKQCSYQAQLAHCLLDNLKWG